MALLIELEVQGQDESLGHGRVLRLICRSAIAMSSCSSTSTGQRPSTRPASVW